MKKLTVLVLSLLFLHAVAASDAHYYMVMFGTEVGANTDFRLLDLRSFLRQAADAHTFGTFARIENGKVTEELTISWLPEYGNFENGYSMPHPRIVPGHNYNLDETLRMVAGKHFLTIGPYEIAPSLYQRARDKVAFLERSGLQYRMVGTGGRNIRVPSDYDQPGNPFNCIMAFGGIGGFADTGRVFGWRASQKIMRTIAATGTLVYDYPWGIRREAIRAMHLIERLRAHGIETSLVGDTMAE